MFRVARAMVLVLLVSAFCEASEWQRVVSTPKGDHADSPPLHNLTYFTDFPESLDEAEPLCYLCSPAETAKRIVQIKNSPQRLHAEVRRIGAIRGFEVFDILYSFRADGQDHLAWKSVVVKVAPARYREIYHYQTNYGGFISPSVISGDILASECDIGVKGMTAEVYFWFNRTGPRHLDTKSILDAAQRVMPAGILLYPVALNGAVAFRSGIFRIQTIPANSGLCCGEGVAEVKVVIDEGEIKVINARYVSRSGQ